MEIAALARFVDRAARVVAKAAVVARVAAGCPALDERNRACGRGIAAAVALPVCWVPKWNLVGVNLVARAARRAGDRDLTWLDARRDCGLAVAVEVLCRVTAVA